LGAGVEEVSSYEFYFENFNNWIFDNGSIISNVDSAWKYIEKTVGYRFCEMISNVFILANLCLQ
tara:strand:+ start:101 stop:292 length:192 start_codon:yes stop_codon:yes gene_type:complete